MTNKSTRTFCDILANIRSCYETRNFSYLPGLIEEMQYRAERVENALEIIGGWKGVEHYEKERVKLKKEVKKLEKRKKELKK